MRIFTVKPNDYNLVLWSTYLRLEFIRLTNDLSYKISSVTSGNLISSQNLIISRNKYDMKLIKAYDNDTYLNLNILALKWGE